MVAGTEFNSLEYLCRVFKWLSIEKKECVLNTARSLLKIQDDNHFPVKDHIVHIGQEER